MIEADSKRLMAAVSVVENACPIPNIEDYTLTVGKVATISMTTAPANDQVESVTAVSFMAASRSSVSGIRAMMSSFLARVGSSS